MNEMLLISYEVPSKSKPELSYRFTFPYGAMVDEIFPAIDEIIEKLKSEAERIKAELDKQAKLKAEQEAAELDQAANS